MFHEFYYKLKKEQKKTVLCSLSSNITSHFEVSNNGSLTKCFSPLKIFELKPGPKGFSAIIQLDKDQHIVHNQSEIACWLQEASGDNVNRIDIELYVRISHKRK